MSLVGLSNRSGRGSEYTRCHFNLLSEVLPNLVAKDDTDAPVQQNVQQNVQRIFQQTVQQIDAVLCAPIESYADAGFVFPGARQHRAGQCCCLFGARRTP